MQGNWKIVVIMAAGLLTGCVTSQRYALLQKEHQAGQADTARLATRVNQLEGDKAQLAAKVRLGAEQLTSMTRRLKTQADSAAAVAARLAKKEKSLLALAEKEKGLSAKLEKAMRELDRLPGIDYEPGSGKLNLSSQVLFESGQSKIRKTGQGALSHLANALKGGEEQLRIEGHSDADPVRKSRGRWEHGNWELSGNRSLQVLAFLEFSGVGGERMRFVGRGPYAPAASNLTSSGKRLNRRVEIYVLPAPSVPASMQK